VIFNSESTIVDHNLPIGIGDIVYPPGVNRLQPAPSYLDQRGGAVQHLSRLLDDPRQLRLFRRDALRRRRRIRRMQRPGTSYGGVRLVMTELHSL